MGVDTKGCLVTKDKDVFKIVEKINSALMDKIKREIDVPIFRADGYSFPRFDVGSSRTMNVYFKFRGEDRGLFITFDCNCDLKNHEEIKGDSCIWFSLGCWGSSEELMKTVLYAVSDMGEIYIDVNDCDDEGFIKL